MASTAEASDAAGVPTAVTTRAPASRRGTTGFRPDIDGLRAVAILLVVGYHATVPGFAAGFIGVDVFFVISGFLIMGQLEGELARTGTLRLATFWARRARRLIPAATLVLCFVALATPLVIPLHRWKDVAAEVLAAAFYGANELYRSRATNYFAPQVATSPLLNMWSLAVEEQFYLFWPVALFLTTRHRGSGRRNEVDARHRRIVAIAGVVALSFVVSLSFTREGSQAAYFSAASRAWEFGIGALLALAAPTLVRWSAARTRVAGAAGVVLLAAAVMTIDERTPFPGTAALLPVFGTALIIVGGIGADPWPGRTLGCRPLQAIGRLSYSWYLWHWPILILGLRWRQDTSVAWHVALVAVALVPALAAYRLVEKPARTWPVLTSSNRRTFVGVAVLLAVSTVSAGVLWARADLIMRDPFIAKAEAARLDLPPLPDVCATTDVAVLEQHCVWGDRTASRTVLLLGDSHAGHWLPTIDQVGQHQRLRVIASMQGSCPGAGFGWVLQRPSCAERIAAIPAMFRALQPDLVVMSNSAGYVKGLLDAEGRVIPPESQLAAWQAGVRDRAEELKGLGVPLLVILDVPHHREDPIECLMREGRAEPCAVSRGEALEITGAVRQAEVDAIAAAGHGTTFEPLDVLCRDDLCPAVDDGVVVYQDGAHLTPTYARTLEEPVSKAVLAALADAPATG